MSTKKSEGGRGRGFLDGVFCFWFFAVYVLKPAFGAVLRAYAVVARYVRARPAF